MNKSHLPQTKPLIIIAWAICLIATLNYSYDFFIRAAPAVMANDLKHAFNIDSTKLGWLSSAYFISYTLMQIPAGVVIDKYNRKYVIGIATTLCVLGNFLFSATNYYEVAFTGRILMGIGSAFGFVGAAKMAAMWLPQRFFSTFMGLATIVGILGGLVTDTFLSSLVTNLGWKHGNDVFTYIGVGLLILVFVFIRDNPKHVEKFTHFSEASFSSTFKKLLQILTNIKFWAASIIGASIFIPINVLGSLWGVGFIQAKLQISEASAAYLNSMLFVGAAIGFALFGIISAFTTRFRFLLILSIVSSIIISSILIYTPIDKNIFIALYLLLGIMAGPQAVTFTIAKTISPPGTSGSSTAGVNMVNNMMPVVLLPTIGYILSKCSSTLAVGCSPIVNYQYALSLVVIILIVCLPLTLLLPKNIDI